MGTISVNYENSGTSDPHWPLLNLTDKINLKSSDKDIALQTLSIYCTWKNIKKVIQQHKFKISAPTWNEEFEICERSCSVSHIQDYFEYILKKPWRKD